jgi:hypothetical protein
MTNPTTLTHPRASGSCQSQPQPCAILRKTVRQLNAIGIYDGATMKAVYARRLKAAEPQLAVAA